MDKISELKQLIYSGTDELSFIATLLCLFGAIIISFLVKMFYSRYSLSLTGKMHIGQVIPILTGSVSNNCCGKVLSCIIIGISWSALYCKV